MQVATELIDEVVSRILAVTSPDAIILFGSAASGRWNEDSDIDLLVLEHEIMDSRELSVRITQALRGLGYAFDVLVCDTGWYEATKDLVGGIAWPAHHEGRILYAA
ncbi:MAG: nucleotidyltransferase domain-containing protein [Candidatus Hydrogenedentes bacterium]|nr:nucleotidyltransferase domain-containing protein [Candidatus Hydrogenedentota bacterium]